MYIYSYTLVGYKKCFPNCEYRWNGIVIAEDMKSAADKVLELYHGYIDLEGIDDKSLCLCELTEGSVLEQSEEFNGVREV